MREHHIYVLTSSGYEGWGAVINEAMAEGCVVIASEATGAGKTLIRNEENGLLIKCGDWKMLGNLLSALSKNPLWRIKLAKEGQRTIEETWSPKVAANRFISVCDAIIGKKVIPLFKTGPMSII
jgi:glycosyltransferase involved in cell wall biosynthesis